MKNSSGIDCAGILIILAFVLIFGTLIVNTVGLFNVDYITVTVTNKENIVQDKQSKYLVFTSNEVFENTDSFWYWKWNSSDVYNQLEVGKTYSVKVYGFRIPFLSMYRNIVEVK